MIYGQKHFQFSNTIQAPLQTRGLLWNFTSLLNDSHSPCSLIIRKLIKEADCQLPMSHQSSDPRDQWICILSSILRALMCVDPRGPQSAKAPPTCPFPAPTHDVYFIISNHIALFCCCPRFLEINFISSPLSPPITIFISISRNSISPPIHKLYFER